MKLRSTRSPLRPLRGQTAIPGDKSITQRALIFGALAAGQSTIAHANVGEDVVALANALTAIGARCDVDAPTETIVVHGTGRDRLHEPGGVLDLRNSGTALRTLLGVVAGMPGHFVLTGDDTLRRRPMLRVVAPLRQMGASIDGARHGDRAPLAVRGVRLHGIAIELPVASAQVKTALLLAGLGADGRTEVTEPAPSRDHTERMLAAAGVPLVREGLTVAVEGGAQLPVMDRRVPGDFSSAMFLIVAATLMEGSDVTLTGVGVNPTRAAALGVLARMGAAVEVASTGAADREEVADLTIRSAALKATAIAPAEVPGLVDEIPALALAATQAEGTTEIRGAEELRVKESDRLAALVRTLGALGADIQELPDGLAIRGPTPLSGGAVDSGGDHRIAMTLAVAGIVAGAPVRVEGWSSVATSFPEFLDALGALRGSKR